MTRGERQRPQPEPVELNILHEDHAVIVLDKPAGQIVHPTYKNASGTLLNGVLWRYRDRPDIQPGILTRLDKGTSGVVVVALTPELHARLQRGRIDKTYIAVVHGTPDPPQGVIALPLGRSDEDRRRVVVREDGQACETRYEVWIRDSGFGIRDREFATRGSRFGAAEFSIVHCTPVTGRTHQIRVHLAALGHPIVGDATYGTADERIARQALHAWRVAFAHPVTREQLLIEAPLPADMLDVSGLQPTTSSPDRTADRRR